MSRSPKSNLRESIKVWRLPELGNIELHRGTSVVRSYPRHWHEEYHLCLIEGGGGDLHYRGATHNTPKGSLFIVHPGEVHANRASDSNGCSYRNFYVHPAMLQEASREIAVLSEAPFFPQPVLLDPGLIHAYATLHETLEAAGSQLEQESLILNLFVQLLTRYAEQRSSIPPARRESRAVNRVRNYLADNYVENVSLKHLARVANLSPFHLNRVFCLELGLPPHAFQTQLRVIQAKNLLHQGWSIAHVAQR